MSLILLNMDSNSDPTIIENSKDRVEKIDRTVLELSVELVLNEGHAVSPRKIEVCNRGRFAVTEAERPGEKIKLWDLKSAKLLQNFTGYDFALSNDILYINKVAKNSAAIFTKDPVEVWDLKSLTQLPAPKWRHRVVKLSSDGSFALSYDLLLKNQPVKESIIFDTDSGKKVVRLFGELIAISKDFTYALINRNGLTFLVKVFENLYLQKLSGQHHCLSSDGQTVLSVSTSGTTYVYQNGEERRLPGKYLFPLCVSSDANVAVLEAFNGGLDIVSLVDFRLFSKIDPKEEHAVNCQIIQPTDFVYRVALLSHSSKTSDNNTPYLSLEIRDFSPLFALSDASKKIYHLSKSDKQGEEEGGIGVDIENMVVVEGGVTSFHVWHLLENRYSQNSLAVPASATACYYNRQSTMILCKYNFGKEGFRWFCWDMVESRMIALDLQQQIDLMDQDLVTMIDFSDHYLIFDCVGKVVIYDLLKNEAISAVCAALLAQERALITAEDGSLSIYDLKNRSVIKELTKTQLKILTCAVAEDVTRAVTVDQEGVATVWDLESAQPIRTVTDLPYDLLSTRLVNSSIGSKGTILLLFLNDQRLQIWNLETGLLVMVLDQQAIRWQISKDETKLLLINSFGQVQVWDLATGILISSICEVADQEVVEFCATGDLSHMMINGQVWDLVSGRPIHLSGSIYQAISPSSKLLLAAKADRLELWNLHPLQLIVTLVCYRNEWLIHTPKLLFEASPEAVGLVSWRLPDRRDHLYPAEELLQECFTEKLLAHL